MLRLTFERKRRGWSQAELSRRTGIHPSVISNLEGSKWHPWPKYKRLLSQVLHVKADMLFEVVPENDENIRAIG